MSDNQSSQQEQNIKKMNELLEEKNKESSQNQQNTNQQEQKNQSIKDNEHTPDENNVLVETKNNRMP